MTLPLVRPRSRSPLPSGRGHLLLASRGLPPDLLEEAARRLMGASLGLAVAFAVALVLNNALESGHWHSFPHLAFLNGIAAAMIVVSLVVAALARGGVLAPGRLIAIGLVYEVVVGFAISMGDNLEPLSPGRPMVDISWLCVWVVVFPVIVPARRLWSGVASFAAASTWLLAFFLGLRLGHPWPGGRVVALNCLENYIAALIALAPAFVLRKLGREVQKAREMGSYALVERLDRGGMGEVWRARHRMLARPAAVKLIRPEMLGVRGGQAAENLLRRFEREAQATASLHSPHTIELYDFGITREWTFYYVMELLEGVDLEDLVRQFGPLPAERVVHLLLQACDSLADAHAAGLIHRDIKPANLYLCYRGLRYDFVKVLDFGLVKAAWNEPEEDISLSQEGMVAGTPAYMAPEVVLGERELDGRADLYALGCVAYWLLTGQIVFERGTPMQMAMHHVKTTPVPPSHRTEAAIPERLERIVLQCLHKDRDCRPASAQALASELMACDLHPEWTQDHARRWWEVHLPGGVPRRPDELETWTRTPGS